MAILGATRKGTAAITGLDVVADALVVYTNDQTSEVVGAWRLRMSTANSARSFASMVESLGLSARVYDREVLITVSSNPESQAFDADALASCPRRGDSGPETGDE
jgi:hypothetical protein